MDKVDIVIVNWNTGVQLGECLRSILGDADTVASVVVVDNASADESQQVADSLDPRVVLDRADANLGFARACNRGARAGEAQYLLFLNPDTRLETGALARCVEFMSDPANHDVGVCGARLYDETGETQRSCARAPRLATFLGMMIGLDRLVPGARGLTMRDWAHDETRRVEHVIGAFYFVRRELFERLGGFDERFFLYLEDLDLSLRVREAGMSIIYLADARAFHAGGGASGQIRARRLFYSLESRLLYGYKHFGAVAGTVLALATLVVEMPVRALRALLSRTPAAVGEVGRASVWLARSLGDIRRGRHAAWFSR